MCVELERTVRPDVGIVAACAGQHAPLQPRAGDLATLHRDKTLLPAADQRTEDDALAEVDPDLEHEFKPWRRLITMLIDLRVHAGLSPFRRHARAKRGHDPERVARRARIVL